MKHLYIVFFLAAISVLLLCGCAEHENLTFEAAYNVDADLDPEGRTMTYTETATVTNTGSDSARVLYFHIYGNMYKNLYKVEDGDIVVTSVRDGNGNALSYRRTQKGVLYRVTLSQALEPEQTTELIFLCEVHIPDLERKYGMSPDGDLQLPSFAAQLAVYDENGWDTAPVQNEGDGRYAAVADYRLTICVPDAYTLACNGTELSRKTSEGITTYSFYGEKRRDLVIIASKDYVQQERVVGSTVILGYFNETVSHVTSDSIEKIMDYAAFALKYFSEIFMEYPYDTLVITNAALGSNFAVNMEYSGLITVYFDTEDANSSALVATYHEIAHQWFYSLIGNDENQEPWLDEGFATFATGLCLEKCGAVDVDTAYWEIYSASDANQAGEVVNVASDKASSYEFIIYHRGCMFLKHLMDTIGTQEFLSILSDYCQQYCYGIATTEDFLATLYAGTEADISAVVNEYIG